MANRALLLILIVAHIALAFFFAARTPYRSSGVLLGQKGPDGMPKQERDIGAPDERQHANYIAHLAQGNGFPVFKPNDPNLYETYESHQPPLYYLAGAAVARVVGQTDADTQAFGSLMRRMNAVVGGLIVLAVYLFALWGWKREDLALGAAAIVAFLPMQVALDAAIGNDPLLILFCTLTLALCVKGRMAGWTTGLAVATGLAVGAAMMTKSSGMLLLPVVVVALILSSSKQRKAVTFLWALLPPLILSAPWWIRNWQLYGDPLAMSAFNEAFKGSAQAKMFVDAFGQTTYWSDWVGWWTLRSGLGAFGYMDIFLPESLYRIWLAILVALSFAWIAREVRGEDPEYKSTLIAGCFLTLMLLLFVRVNLQYFQAQARYLLPAIGVIAVGLAGGVQFLLKQRAAIGLAALALYLLGVNLYTIDRLPDEFQKRGATISQTVDSGPAAVAKLEPNENESEYR